MSTPSSIGASVGRGGANQPCDVSTIQQLINCKLPAGAPALDVSGQCDDATVAAIEQIQKNSLQMANPDGRVDPGGATWRFLTGAAAPGVFPDDVIRACQCAHVTWRIPASVTLAQWALESSWGRSMPPGSNNPFGIKATDGQPFVECNTHEVVDGQTITIVARFRQFASIMEAIDQHGNLLATKAAYAHARTLENDPNAFADALTGVYATDPNYGASLRSIMSKHNLYQYD